MPIVADTRRSSKQKPDGNTDGKASDLMHGLKPVSLFAISATAVIAMSLLTAPARTQTSSQDGPAAAATAKPQWAASATGRVEPRNGNILISTPTPGRVADVAVAANDEVKAGDLLIRLDEEDLSTRVAAAMVEAQVRERERDEEPVKGPALERRQAEDSVASAERALYRARLALDAKAFQVRSTGVTADLEPLRFQVAAAREQLANSRANLLRVQSQPGMPFATRLESSLAGARAELSIAEAAMERARIRAPSNGTVLGVYVKYGELAAPSPESPLIVFGDLSALRVKAEVEERDAPKLKVGLRAVIKADAFPDREFTGVVTSVSQSMAAPRIPPRGVRRPTDVEVAEVTVAIDGKPPLLSGMRVDVFFKSDLAPATTTGAAAGTATGTPRTSSN